MALKVRAWEGRSRSHRVPVPGYSNNSTSHAVLVRTDSQACVARTQDVVNVWRSCASKRRVLRVALVAHDGPACNELRVCKRHSRGELVTSTHAPAAVYLHELKAAHTLISPSFSPSGCSARLASQPFTPTHPPRLYLPARPCEARLTPTQPSSPPPSPRLVHIYFGECIPLSCPVRRPGYLYLLYCTHQAGEPSRKGKAL